MELKYFLMDFMSLFRYIVDDNHELYILRFFVCVCLQHR